MSEHVFGVSRQRITRDQARKLERIAKRHDATLVEVVLPGVGYQRWFAGPNLGFPFDRAVETAVACEIAAECPELEEHHDRPR